MSDLRELYQELIVDHSKRPRNFGKLSPATHHAEGHNPLCGDHIGLALKLNGDAIEGIAFQGEACAICKASASMMTATVKGRTRQDAETLIREFRDMATGKLDIAGEPNHLGRLTVFAGVRDLPSRVKCAILPWHTLHAALHSESVVSTEGDQDPVAVAS